MEEQPFELLLEGEPSLLRRVEDLVVDAHRRWYAASGGTAWTEPKAYHWLRYEDPRPVQRLADGVVRLDPLVGFDPALVEAAREVGRSLGYELGGRSGRK